MSGTWPPRKRSSVTGWIRALLLLVLLLALLDPRLAVPARTLYLLDLSPSARDASLALASRLDGVVLGFAEEVRRLSPGERPFLGERTRLDRAFQEALKYRPDRVVLVSDGLFEPLVPPFPLFAVHVPPQPFLEVRLLPPALPLLGETVGVGVRLSAPVEVEARLLLGGPAGPRRYALRVEGERRLLYTFPLTQAAQVRAVAEGPWGRSEDRVEVRPLDQARALVLGDRTLAALLRAQGFQVEEGPFRLPLEADLVAVGLGVLDLPEGAAQALRDYLEAGGGVLFTARAVLGGWDRALPDHLPLKPKKTEGAALVLVLDVSGSMQGEKLALAVEGALRLVEAASEEDRLGVIAFSGEARWVFRPRPMTPQGKKEAQSLLRSLGAGGGTVLGPAYREAVSALREIPGRKAILVLSDGEVSDPQAPILEEARRAGFPTSALALGQDADRAFLKALAEAGGGAYLEAPEARLLPRLLLAEGERVFRGEGMRGRFPVQPRPHPLTEGFSFPPVGMRFPARAEPWAEVLLLSQKDPLLALGERGEGRVAALAADLSSWAFPELPGFVGGLARHLSSRRSLRVEVREGRVLVVVGAGLDEAPRLLSAGVERPLLPVGRGRYEGVLEGEGVVLWGRRQVPVRTGFLEYPPLDGRRVLAGMAEASGGRLLDPSELAALPGARRSLREPLLWLALGLFLLEGLVRYRLGE
ncbi:vWA domain-containing protein [Thermus filiformis]|uniref:vWA domain-containing protein n=1 Tax=Thermus filiformis TaxID=276 RepID=UPI0005EBF59D|nr:vWA domain-containing protein [Thermus filiformis]